jgi:hypothetical protein
MKSLVGVAISCHPFTPRSSTHNVPSELKTLYSWTLRTFPRIFNVHYIHTSNFSGLYMDITDTTEPAVHVANRRVTASRLYLTFPFSNIHALSFHFSTSCSTFSPFSSLGRYRKNSLVVTLHTSTRDVFRKGLSTYKPSLFRYYVPTRRYRIPN